MSRPNDIPNIAEIRAQFPILNTEMRGKPLVFFDNAASSQTPICVSKTIEDYYNNTHSNVHRGVYELSQKATDAFENARQKVATFINAKESAEIIFTKGTTDGINLVASSFGSKFIKSGDEILISAMEHHSNIVPWQMLCERTGAKLKVIEVKENGELDYDSFLNLLNEKTKLVSVVHISNALGTINPIKNIISQAHNKGIPVLIDGAQATPHEKIDVQDLDADFYVFSGHKAYGPTGFGVLYGKRKWLESIPPYQGGGEMIESVSFENTTYNVIPFKFEAGTPDIEGAIAMSRAIDFIEEIGYSTIQKQEQTLLDYATYLMSDIKGIRIIGCSDQKASVISFVVDDIHSYDIGTLLDKQGFAVRTGHHCTQPLMNRFGLSGTVRASFAVYNTVDEVDVFIKALRRSIDILR